ncbi:MAG: metallophosphoesterase, partial [Actinomycetota bacterium]
MSVSLGIVALVVSAMSTGAVGQVGAVPQAAASQPVTIAVIGDYGGDNGGEYRLADLVARLKPDAVATVGDNLYPTPPTVTGTDKYDLVVGKFFCQFLAGVPAGPYCNGRQSAVNRFFPATGNHDYSDGPIANYLAYFSLPGRGVTSEFPTGSEQYYDVVLGPVHLFFIDSQLTEGAFPDAPTFAEQKAWLQRSMAAATEPWKLVLFHHPAYSSGTTYGSTPAMQWPYGAWGADLVLSGHHHSYERIVRSDTTYFVVGLGGASRFPFDPPIPGSEVRFNGDEGALRLTATDTSLVAEFITTSNVLIDRYTLTKQVTPPTTSTTTSTTTTVPRTTTTTST